jgi:hypothetical protein
MRSRKCNEIPQMPKGMASDLRQYASELALLRRKRLFAPHTLPIV